MNMVATQSIARWRGSPAIDERVAQIEANGAITFMHTDRQSSVVAISDSTGNVSVQNRRGYGTYGETDSTQMTGPATHPFGYTGRRWDPDLNLYYYRARWYDPQLGTFLETDPIGSLDYVNLYSYVGLEPGNYEDPSGMWRPKDSRGRDIHYLTPEQKAADQRDTDVVLRGVAIATLRLGGPVISAIKAIPQKRLMIFSFQRLLAGVKQQPIGQTKPPSAPPRAEAPRVPATPKERPGGHRTLRINQKSM